MLKEVILSLGEDGLDERWAMHSEIAALQYTSCISYALPRSSNRITWIVNRYMYHKPLDVSFKTPPIAFSYNQLSHRPTNPSRSGCLPLSLSLQPPNRSSHFVICETANSIAFSSTRLALTSVIQKTLEEKAASRQYAKE